MFHPGGALGRRLLLKVENVMHTGKDNPLIHCGKTVKDALFVMTDKGLGAVSVVDGEGSSSVSSPMASFAVRWPRITSSSMKPSRTSCSRNR